MVFSKFDFTSANGLNTAEKANKKSKDPKAALQSIQKQKDKVKRLEAKGNQDAVKSIEETSTWSKALEKAEGVKVKDDEGLLKKSIKKLDQKKKSSKRKWDARVEGEENRKKMQQQKRSDNIKKRKQDIKQSKLKKASKKGRSIPGFR